MHMAGMGVSFMVMVKMRHRHDWFGGPGAMTDAFAVIQAASAQQTLRKISACKRHALAAWDAGS
jgi:hypothetical protein